MTTSIGLWIDHRKAVIVTLQDDRESTQIVRSNVERQPVRGPRPSRASAPRPSRNVLADDSEQRRMSGMLAGYYDRVIARLGAAGPVFIVGPGEASGELAKRIEQIQPGKHRVAAVEAADRMTTPQVAARVRDHFQVSAPRSGARKARSPATKKRAGVAKTAATAG